MIILRNLKWDNWFSYGENNYIDFEKDNLTQILGKNGSGKTSIIHILEEILYNKNSKGVKKTDLMNRSKKDMSAELNFSIDSDNYKIILSRKSTAKVSLFKNLEDISSHTATNTFKDIQKILGMDFLTFNQLVYQSSKVGLEFLTSADSARKKFLIALFNLDVYTEYYEKFKQIYNELQFEQKELEGKAKVLSKWLIDNKDTNLSLMPLKDAIDDSNLVQLLVRINTIETEIKNIEETNINIAKNNRLLKDLSDLESKKDESLLLYTKEVPNNTTLVSKRAVINNSILEDKKLIRSLVNLQAECPTCKQLVDNDIKNTMIQDAESRLSIYAEELDSLEAKMTDNNKKLHEIDEAKKLIDKYNKLKDSIDLTISTELVDKNTLDKEVKDLTKEYYDLKEEVSKIDAYNTKARAHNVKVETIVIELEKNRKALLEVESSKITLESLKSKIDILKTVFSTKGLVSYKIDYLVKDLQDKINEYLVILSDGRFQLNFILKGDNINIGIVDNGNAIDISALSTGELSRVNVATLLAIRALMSTLSNTKINLLFLDEIMGVLDEVGKNNLIDILLEEKDLNTFIVSHEYTHPLLAKLYVNTGKGGSEIEHK